ncbi:MAG TPA: DNA-directed RNA polymerase subunit RpoH/Rpb5 C-terminal domain-containing protein [Thermoplasmata archaeon]|nr:DNA-directed RNA polymerase subunit RpoH/Rpb5 C-terminal domain-containing protein [Thermoplasmata archaeon]
MPTAKRPTKSRPAKGASAVPKPAPRPFVAPQLVPPHEILGEDETRRVLGEIGSGIERLPKILTNDPGLQTDPNYAKLKEAGEVLPGRLVRIRRPSATAGSSVGYRVLIRSLGD